MTTGPVSGLAEERRRGGVIGSFERVEGLRPMATHWAGLALDRPRVMGILNVTPDSFSDGGLHAEAAQAIAAGLAMAEAGADIIDVGGESTRPGSAFTPPALEQARILPVIAALSEAGLRISVDTRNAATMAAALDAGAAIINDVSGLADDPDAAPLVAARGCAVVLMHMRGTPATMNDLARYDDVAAEVRDELALRLAAAETAGIRREAIMLDPGIGFAKMRGQNLAMLRGLPVLAELGLPILVGVSRKTFIGHLTGGVPPQQRMPGSLAAGLFAVARGASVLRVHDVAATVQALRVWQALAVPESAPA
jgi:dihydropteroate synthase